MNKMKLRALEKWSALLLYHMMSQPAEEIPSSGDKMIDRMNGGKGRRIDNAPIPKERFEQCLNFLKNMTMEFKIKADVDGETVELVSKEKFPISETRIIKKGKRDIVYMNNDITVSAVHAFELLDGEIHVIGRN